MECVVCGLLDCLSLYPVTCPRAEAINIVIDLVSTKDDSLGQSIIQRVGDYLLSPKTFQSGRSSKTPMYYRQFYDKVWADMPRLKYIP